ncbi:hypothetical protein [Chitinophaga sp. LS1]|uniref:hypothetical protein n=1 Tax=Chitinophaga sp. LS1 TaxID=3051176 RepID=UPI002AAAD738|nr:hypothetical protein [Chitinophaga sp. LS1]WPV63976.1 hypothetical protein QQL36_19435 [Chitinophaga sp. LS1]
MNIKSLLPYDRYTLTTRLNEGEVRRRLEANVAPPKKPFSLLVQRYGLKKNTTDKPYVGVVVGPHFEIVRVINYKNSFLPVTKGEMSNFLGQTEIKVKSSPHLAVMIFSGVWLFMVLVGCVAVLGASINDGFEPVMLIPFGMFVFGCLLFTIPYKLEAKKTKRFLAELLEAEEVKEG